MSSAPAPITVLIVDDMHDLRDLLRDVIAESSEFEVIGEARDGLEAIELAQATQPNLILLDLSMPRMDGLEALPRLRDVAPASRIVVLSGFGQDRLGETALRLGASAYLEKGVSPTELLIELAKVAARARRIGRARTPQFSLALALPTYSHGDVATARSAPTRSTGAPSGVRSPVIGSARSVSPTPGRDRQYEKIRQRNMHQRHADVFAPAERSPEQQASGNGGEDYGLRNA
jgi:DNA-binding NarL/FixJ family response regulator